MFLKSPERALDALFAVDGTFTPNMLFEILRRGDRQKLILKSAANMQTETFKSMMLGHHHVDDMAKMYNALKAVKPDTVMNEDEFRDLAKEKAAEAVSSYYQEQDKIKAYIHGDIAFDEVYPIVKRTKLDYHVAATCNYIEHFGEDDFIVRCIVVLGGSVGTCNYQLSDLTGYGRDQITDVADRVLGVGLNTVQALDICGNMMELYSPYSTDKKSYIDSFSCHTDEIAAENITKCNAAAKIIALNLFANDEDKYRRQILALAGDSAKAVTEIIADIVIKHPDWSDDIRALLQSKKSSARDLALTVIERQGAKAYIPALKEALSAEKTDKLKARIGSMLAVVLGEDSAGETASAGDIVQEMTKGKKTAKLDWLFTKPFTPVHKTDGTEADESWLKALMLCFANSVGLKDPSADVIAAALVPEDVYRLANETLERWLTTSAATKSEWVEFFQRDGFAYLKRKREKKSYTLNVRFTESEMQDILARCEQYGYKNKTEYIRDCVRARVDLTPDRNAYAEVNKAKLPHAALESPDLFQIYQTFSWEGSLLLLPFDHLTFYQAVKVLCLLIRIIMLFQRLTHYKITLRYRLDSSGFSVPIQCSSPSFYLFFGSLQHFFLYNRRIKRIFTIAVSC